jgi:hypothetical protein
VAYGTNWELKFNGVTVASLPASPPQTPTTGTFIGSDANTGFFIGDIDDARIYNSALSNSEILALVGYHPTQVTTWSPNPVTSSLKVYLQADSLTNLLNGNNVNNWDDSSGNGNHITAVNPPSFQSSGLNGKPSVNFSSVSNHHLARAITTGLTGSNFSIFSVINPTLVANSSHGIMSIATACASYDKEQSLVWMPGPLHHVAEGGICNIISVPGSSDPLVSGSSYIKGLVYQISSTATLLLNGKILASDPTPGTGFSSADYALTIGQRRAQGALTAFNGHISEVLYFDGALSSSNRTIVQCYLSSKYNIDLSAAVSCP